MPTKNIKLPRYAVFAKPRTSSVVLQELLKSVWESKYRKLDIDEMMWCNGRGVSLYRTGIGTFFEDCPEDFPPFKIEACNVLPEHMPFLETFVHNNNYIPIFIDRDKLELLTSFYISSLTYFHDYGINKQRNFATPPVTGSRKEEFFSWSIDERLERLKEIVNIVLVFHDRDKSIRAKFPNHVVLNHEDFKDDVPSALQLLDIELEEPISYMPLTKKSKHFDISTEEKIALAEFAELMT